MPLVLQSSHTPGHHASCERKKLGNLVPSSERRNLLLVVWPGAPGSVLAPSSDALCVSVLVPHDVSDTSGHVEP